MLKITKLYKILVLIIIKINNVKDINKNGLKLNLSKFKKIKIFKFKNLSKSKNYIILFKS